MREGNHPNVDTLCELVSDLGTNRPHQMLQRQMLLLRLDAHLLMLHTGIPVGGCQHGVSTVQSRSCESRVIHLRTAQVHVCGRCQYVSWQTK